MLGGAPSASKYDDVNVMKDSRMPVTRNDVMHSNQKCAEWERRQRRVDSGGRSMVGDTTVMGPADGATAWSLRDCLTAHCGPELPLVKGTSSMSPAVQARRGAV